MVTPAPSLAQRIEKIGALDRAYKAPQKIIKYGTAGFRSKADQLDRHCFRSGVFMGIKARVEKMVGVQITASHNPKEDNGIKMQEKEGGTLKPWWEKLTDNFANAQDFEEELEKFIQIVQKEYNKEDIFAEEEDEPLLVLGYDTRESSARLHNAIIAGAEAVGVRSLDFDLVTTPQLCWLVSRIHENDFSFIRVDKNDYVHNYTQKFKNLLALIGDKPT